MIRIAITGPECCGKSTLCEWLSERIFDARVRLAVAVRLALAHALIVDTDFYVLDIWWRERFGESNEEIITMKETYDFDLYLICQPDLPWEKDALRENPEDRERLFAMYVEDLFNDGKTVEIVKGSGEDRMERVLQKILMRFPNLMTEED